MDEKEYKLPLGLFKQATLKLDAFMSDVHEIMVDEGIDSEDKAMLGSIIEISNQIMANLVNIIRKECDEEEFISENIPMDIIAPEYEEEARDLAEESADE